MSRSGYCDDYEGIGLWRGAVASAIRGKRGQNFLRELLATLDAMPEKRLLAVTINTGKGCCTLGSVTKARGVDTNDLDERIDAGDDWGIGEELAERLGIASAMAQEIVYMNDEAAWNNETPEQRYSRMREWVEAQITKTPDP